LKDTLQQIEFEIEESEEEERLVFILIINRNIGSDGERCN